MAFHLPRSGCLGTPVTLPQSLYGRTDVRWRQNQNFSDQRGHQRVTKFSYSWCSASSAIMIDRTTSYAFLLSIKHLLRDYELPNWVYWYQKSLFYYLLMLNPGFDWSRTRCQTLIGVCSWSLPYCLASVFFWFPGFLSSSKSHHFKFDPYIEDLLENHLRVK